MATSASSRPPAHRMICLFTFSAPWQSTGSAKCAIFKYPTASSVVLEPRTCASSCRAFCTAPAKNPGNACPFPASTSRTQIPISSIRPSPNREWVFLAPAATLANFPTWPARKSFFHPSSTAISTERAIKLLQVTASPKGTPMASRKNRSP